MPFGAHPRAAPRRVGVACHTLPGRKFNKMKGAQRYRTVAGSGPASAPDVYTSTYKVHMNSLSSSSPAQRVVHTVAAGGDDTESEVPHVVHEYILGWKITSPSHTRTHPRTHARTRRCLMWCTSIS